MTAAGKTAPKRRIGSPGGGVTGSGTGPNFTALSLDCRLLIPFSIPLRLSQAGPVRVCLAARSLIFVHAQCCNLRDCAGQFSLCVKIIRTETTTNSASAPTRSE
jgi:hypothetical protein